MTVPTLRSVTRTLLRALSPRRPAPARPAPAVEEYERTAGLPRFEYAPHADGLPDPGEVVWTWVPYEEDPSRGKDRPVLVLARAGAALIAAPLTSKDHDRDAADEARYGRYWLDVGSGAWDRQGRPSEVRLDRLLRVDPARVRREGGRLDRSAFDRTVQAIRQLHGT